MRDPTTKIRKFKKIKTPLKYQRRSIFFRKSNTVNVILFCDILKCPRYKYRPEINE